MVGTMAAGKDPSLTDAKVDREGRPKGQMDGQEDRMRCMRTVAVISSEQSETDSELRTQNPCAWVNGTRSLCAES